MVRTVINSRNANAEERELLIESMSYYEGSRETIMIVSKGHMLMEDDLLSFIEDDGDQRYFFQRSRVIEIIDEDTFLINGFPDRELTVTALTTATTTYFVDSNPDYETRVLRYVKFEIADEHDMMKYRGDVTVVDNIDDLYYYGKPDRFNRRCVGDYVLCDRFLYTATSITDKYKYVVEEGKYLNNNDDFVYFTGKWAIEYKLGGGRIESGGTTAKDSRYLGEKVSSVTDTIRGVLIVPSNYYGKDSTKELWWAFDPDNLEDNEIVKYLLSNSGSITLKSRDHRFYREVYDWARAEDYELFLEDGMGMYADRSVDSKDELPDPSWRLEGEIYKVGEAGVPYICKCVRLELNSYNHCGEEVQTSRVIRYYGFYNVFIPSADDYGIDSSRNEVWNDMYIEQEKEKGVNAILDYERIQFSPMYIDGYEDGSEKPIFKPVTKIIFNLHFRERPYDEVEGIVRDYGEFETSDSYYWNTAKIDYEDGNKFKVQSYDSDLLGDIGFTDNDVYYQKKKLKNTFIRISCYDTRYRSTQSLYGYSTVFLDAGKYYSKYISAVTDKKLTINDEGVVYENFSGLTEDEREKYRLGVSFECANKYSTEMSSDGFYIHTYPTIVSGITPTEAYLKVEFNHAKYGKTIPMTFPMGDDGLPILRDDEEKFYNEFPINYRKTVVPEGVPYASDMEMIDIDVQRVFSDSYIRINLQYDDNTKQYIWYLPKEVSDNVNVVNKENGEMTITLWEPRLNGLRNNEKDANAQIQKEPNNE